jgi:hypothetical protein
MSKRQNGTGRQNKNDEESIWPLNNFLNCCSKKDD